MRKKIGNRIGPVPIALVAVLALAALLSAGLLFTLNSNVTQAQGLNPLGEEEENDSATKCEVTIANVNTNNGDGPITPAIGGLLNGGCNVSGAEATVTFGDQRPR